MIASLALAAALFAPGSISTPDWELRAAFSPDGRELLLGRFPRPVILHARRTAEGWSAPEVVPFSGRHEDFGAAFSPDGRWVYFSSDRHDARALGRGDLWRVPRNASGFGRPQHLGAAVNSSGDETSPTVARSGNLYFMSDRTGGAGGYDLYVAAPEGTGFAKPRPVPGFVNGVHHEENPWIDADERMLFFQSARPGGQGNCDIYVSFNVDGLWSPPVNLGPQVNGPSCEYDPSITPDGRTFVFSSFGRGAAMQPSSYAQFTAAYDALENGSGNVYHLPVEALDLPRLEREARQAMPPAPRREGWATRFYEMGAAFSPDGERMVETISQANVYDRRYALVQRTRTREGWSEPRLVEFPGPGSDRDAAFSPDGKRVAFATTRDGKGGARRDFDLWIADVAPGGLVNARPLEGVNSARDDFAPSWTAEGGLIFTSSRAGGLGGWDLWEARAQGEGFAAAVNVGAPINSPTLEAYSVVLAGGAAMIFAADARGKNAEDFDLFISRRVDGRWSEPQRLEGINGEAQETAPSVHGDRLYFSSTRAEPPRKLPLDAAARERWLKSPGNGLGDPHSIPLSAIIGGLPRS